MIERARSGDHGAFEALYRAHHRPVARRLSHLGGPEAPVADLLQETFVRAFRAIGHYRAEAPFSHWLMRIASNVACSHHRKRRWLRLWDDPAREKEVPAGGRGLDAVYPELWALHRALDRMSPRLREAVVLYEIEGLSLAEIAAELGIPPNTVASRLRRGRRRLRRQLEQLGLGPMEAVAAVALCEGGESS